MDRERIKNEFSAMLLIAVKDIKIYYSKPPVIMFGLIWPFFMFLAFLIKRQMNPADVFGGLSSMALFFMASSIGPVIIPIEKRQGTYDRFLSAPISLFTLVLGKTIPGMVFGMCVALVPLVIGLFCGAQVPNLFFFILFLFLGGFSFSSLGILFSSFQVQSTGSVMIGTNFIRLPSLFISGIFLGLEELPAVILILSFISPLTYAHDLMNWSMGAESAYFPWIIDIAGLIVFSMLFVYGAIWLHEKARKET
ncbi:MAG: ABC transporter permease [Candidatus Hodarchaeales archaeon]